MSLPLPNASESVVGRAGEMSPAWFDFMARAARAIDGPMPLKPVLVADLPPRAADGWIAFASDAGGGGVPVYSRGGQWLRFDTNTEVT